ncbi:MAG TPA: MetQ/NlpA family ABC transporter substrate-binding protein [Polyangiaceae bacterium]|nr:MetQ/NlpA family ABC transporter substrate-binding protein [Polyangiaceae bacterium]
MNTPHESAPPLLGARSQRVLSLLLAAFTLFAAVRLLGWWPGHAPFPLRHASAGESAPAATPPATTAPATSAPGAPHSGTSIGVLGGPEAEVLDFVAARNPRLALRVVRYSDPQRLRADLESGTLDAGSFENAVALQSSGSPALADAGTTLTLPFGFYSRRVSVHQVPREGLTIALPQQPEALARALLVLFHQGWLVLPEERGAQVTLADVQKNPLHLVLQPLPPNELATALDRFDLVGLDYSSATRAGLAPARHARVMEDGFSHFPQILTVRRADRERAAPWLTNLISAYRSPAVKDFILRHFEDSVRRPW